MDGLDPNDLIIFASVAQEGSFKKASERLRIPHSTVSRRVMALEERLGEKLLHRTTRRIALSDLGGAVLLHARQVAAEVEATAQLVRNSASEPSGHLRVSMPTDFTSDMLAGMVARLTSMHPKLSVDIDVSRRRVDLIGESFDVAVRIGDLLDDATLAAKRVGTIEMGIYASPGYLARCGTPTHPSDLSSHENLHLTQRIGEPGELRLVSRAETWHGIPPGRITANSPGILLQLALTGAGLAPLADHLAAGMVRAGTLVKVLPGWHQAPIPIWAIMPGRRLLPLRTRVFVGALRAELSASANRARDEPSGIVPQTGVGLLGAARRDARASGPER